MIHQQPPTSLAMEQQVGVDKGTKAATVRQDSGVPEDLPSPATEAKQPEYCETDNEINGHCNITIIQTADKNALGFAPEGKDSKDGSDSGVEGCNAEVPRDFEGSCDALNESNASCDSSLASCCSVYEDPCAILSDDLNLTIGGGGEGTSEGGSESSSIAGSVPARGATSKKSATNGSATGATASPGKKKSSTEPQRTARQTKPVSGAPNAKPARSTIIGSRDRAKSREKHQSHGTNLPSTNGAITGSTYRSPTAASTTKSRIRNLPDSLPSPLTTEIGKDLAQKGRLSHATRTTRATSNSRLRTPASTPSEDRRKTITSTSRTNLAYKFETPKQSPNVRYLISDRMSMSLDSKAINAYVTLPRKTRAKAVPKSTEKTDGPLSRSRSVSRDASLNRMVGRKSGSVSSKESLASRSLPPHPKSKVERTRIYHETGVQTGITSADLESILAGLCTSLPNPESIERVHSAVQTEGTWEELQTLKCDFKRALEESSQQKLENESLKVELAQTKRRLEDEQADHAFARQELERNAQRVMAMLGTPLSEQAEGGDSFLELETHLQSSGKVVANQQVQIADLESLCRMLKRDLEKSLAAQKSLIQQQEEFELESRELQDFLQEEKLTLAESLKEAETELREKNEALKLVQSELDRKTEECKHLVRISEQRRQENLSLNMKLNAIERKSRELLLAQGATVSGAAVALSGLGNRLEALVDQLISSYNISEKDLEEMVYYNEAYSQSNSSIESSPVSSKHSLKDCTPSPKRGSFVLAVLGAIKNAATHPFVMRSNDSKIKESSRHAQKDLSTESSSELLDFETEPCLMMESVLEDVSLPDTYSHNMVSSSDSLRRVISAPKSTDESLSNLSQAIMHRRKVEDEEEENCESVSESETGFTESLAPLSEYCPNIGLVDQVIDVDNLVTKLLKVLRIIQLDNDTCIQDLKEQKYELEMKLDGNILETKEVYNNVPSSNEDLPVDSKNSLIQKSIAKDNKVKESEQDVKIDRTIITPEWPRDNQDENSDCLTTRSCS